MKNCISTKEACQSMSNDENHFPTPQITHPSDAALNSFGAEAMKIVASPEVPRWDGHSTGSPGRSLGD